MPADTAQVYVGVGSNLMRRYHLRTALMALRCRFGPLQVSQVYRSAAVGFSGPPFYNLVCGFHTGLAPAALVRALRGIERRHGRRRRCGSRTLDVDLLLYGDRVRRRTPGPILPHPDLTERAFVLRPLTELAGERVEPLGRGRIADLWRDFRGGPRLAAVAFRFPARL